MEFNNNSKKRKREPESSMLNSSFENSLEILDIELEVSEVEDLSLNFKSKMFDSALNDLEIIVGKENFRVFRACSYILAARCEIFENMFFRSGLKEQMTKKWELPEANPNTFSYFLEYLYTGKVKINSTNVLDLYELSEQYFFSKLNLSCQQFLKRSISHDNVFSMLDSSIKMDAKEVVDHCWKLLDQNTKEVLESPNTVLIPERTLELLLTRNTSNIKEIDLFRFLVNWSKHHTSPTTSWQTVTKSYLHHIRFPLMTSKELIREVRPLGIVSDAQYIEALEFNSDPEFFQDIQKQEFRSRKGVPLDVFLSGPNYSLSNSNKVATKTSTQKEWNTTIITNPVSKGIHRWSLKIRNTTRGSINLGVSPHSIDQSQINTYKSGWYFFPKNNSLYSGPPHKYFKKSFIPISETFVNGSVLDIELNMNEGKIKYYSNGKDFGVAFESIPVDSPLVLTILLIHQYDSVELLSHRQY